MEDSYRREVDEVVKHFNVDPEKGLDTARVEQLLQQFGLNGK